MTGSPFRSHPLYLIHSCCFPSHLSGDILRGFRKNPKIAILAISPLIKSITYEHQNHKFRVFRQRLRIHVICRNCRYLNTEKFLRFQKALSRFFILIDYFSFSIISFIFFCSHSSPKTLPLRTKTLEACIKIAIPQKIVTQ